jgi:hypothetical protein
METHRRSSNCTAQNPKTAIADRTQLEQAVVTFLRCMFLSQLFQHRIDPVRLCSPDKFDYNCLTDLSFTNGLG